MDIQHTPFTQEFDDFAFELVRNGTYPSASDVLHAAIVALRREICNDEAKLLALPSAIQEGFNSGVFEGDAIQSVREEFGLTVGQ